MLKKKNGKIRSRVYGFLSGNGGFGMNELLGIAIALILAAFIIIPGLKIFAGSVMTGLNDWWDHTIITKLFPTVL
jgi:hypothetical protein